jgi:serine/threonine protein kinase HipA of HipAB toxin-antitoxin module
MPAEVAEGTLNLQARLKALTLRELYSRLVFNILCGNTDDHARNHAAFRDGKPLS